MSSRNRFNSRPAARTIALRWLTVGGVGALALVVAILAGVALTKPAVVVAEPTPTATESLIPVPTPPPATRPLVKAYMIGDSITGGSGTGGNPVTPGARIATSLNWMVETDGVGGSGFVAFGRQLVEGVDEDRSMSTRLPAVVAAAPDVVIVAAGRNDSGERLPLVQQRIESFFTDLRAQLPNAKIVAVSPWLWDIPEEASQVDKLGTISGYLADTAAEVGAVYIDSRSELWRLDETNRALMVSEDGWHPNASGYSQLGSTLSLALVAHGLPRGPERWRETAPLSGEWYDPSDATFAPAT